jgi:transcriptional regulator of NAD metabolism
MKKLNSTYLDNLVSKILKETLENRAENIVSKLTESGSVCECGGTMYEG